MYVHGQNNTDAYWEKRYRSDFTSPKDWRFVIYSPFIWKQFNALLHAGARGIDLGAGGGTLTHALRSGGLNCIGLERSCGGVASARSILPTGAVLQGDALCTPIHGAVLDFVVSSMVIEHLDDRLMVGECHRILKPSGIAMITSVLRKKHAWYWRRNAQGEIVIDETHLREYGSREEFMRLFESAGFEVLHCETPSLRFPLVDPFLKLAHRVLPGMLKSWPSSRLGNWLRRISRIPVPRYHAVELIAQKKDART